MEKYGLAFEKVEDVEIKGNKYTKLTSGFLSPDNKKLEFYYDWQEETYTDRWMAYTAALGKPVGLDVFDLVAARYHCQRGKLGNFSEMQSDDPVALIQAMLAVYAWCEMEKWLIDGFD